MDEWFLVSSHVLTRLLGASIQHCFFGGKIVNLQVSLRHVFPFWTFITDFEWEVHHVFDPRSDVW